MMADTRPATTSDLAGQANGSGRRCWLRPGNAADNKCLSVRVLRRVHDIGMLGVRRGQLARRGGTGCTLGRVFSLGDRAFSVS